MSRYLDLVRHVVQVAELEAAPRGFTSIVDFPSGWAVEAWQQHAAPRSVGLRVEAVIYPEWLDDLVAVGAGTGDELAENLKVGPLKIITGGSMGSRTAHYIASCPNPLPGCPNGKPSHTRSELLALLRRAREARLQTVVRIVGDATCHDILDVFEISGMRGSVEHAQCIVPVDLPRFARLKLAASIQPAHWLEGIGVVGRVWPGAEDRTYPMLDPLHVGARLTFGSDTPVASLDPWRVIGAACHRPYRVDQAPALLTALWASTRTTLSAGRPVDLVLTADPEKMLLTMLGGRITFSR